MMPAAAARQTDLQGLLPGGKQAGRYKKKPQALPAARVPAKRVDKVF
jgi:hypothetical protein